jgi:hypothetical protein
VLCESADGSCEPATVRRRGQQRVMSTVDGVGTVLCTCHPLGRAVGGRAYLDRPLDHGADGLRRIEPQPTHPTTFGQQVDECERSNVAPPSAQADAR